MMAILAKEWRRLLRNGGTPWALLAYLLLPVLVTGVYLASLAGGQSISPQVMTQLGGHALNLVGTWQIILLAVAGPFVAAGLIAGEEEDGTLPSLLAAGPSFLVLVLAKLAAAIAFLLVVIVAGLPLFTLPVLVGGLTWPMIGRTVLLEVATAVAMAAVGLLFSALGRRSGTVALVSIALGLLLTLGGGMVSNTAPANAYNPDQMIMQIKMGMRFPAQAPQTGEQIDGWLYANPLVGLNSAINQSAGQGMFGLPGANLGPVWRGYRLWQVQAVGAAALVPLAVLAATAALWVRIRWAPPAIRRPMSMKEVTSGD